MNIGILEYRQYPFISANTAIAYTIGNSVLKHKVIYIGRKQDECQNTVTNYKGCKIRFLNDQAKDESKSRIKNVFRRVVGDDLFFLKDAFALRKIIKDENINALICIIAPSDNAHIALSIKLGIPVYLYQLDPFYNFCDKEDARLKKDFIKILKKAKYLFTTELLYDIYSRDYQFSEYLDKISVLQFPKLINPKIVDSYEYSEEKHTLLYAGTLYHGIRNPKILADLKRNLPKEFEFVFCGNCDDVNDMEMLRKAGIICKGYCSQDALAEEIEKADILVNIGNLVQNQLGSKIVDYIATGKPILNVTQFKECPTKAVLSKYQNYFDIDISEFDNEKKIEELERFIVQNTGKRIDFEEICKEYIEYTPEYVSKKIIDVIESK